MYIKQTEHFRRFQISFYINQAKIDEQTFIHTILVDGTHERKTTQKTDIITFPLIHRLQYFIYIFSSFSYDFF
jgi:hypothetical protein